MGGSVLRWVPSTTRVSTHIVAFDMDGTLIKTKSGVCGVFAVHISKFSFPRLVGLVAIISYIISSSRHFWVLSSSKLLEERSTTSNS